MQMFKLGFKFTKAYWGDKFGQTFGRFDEMSLFDQCWKTKK